MPFNMPMQRTGLRPVADRQDWFAEGSECQAQRSSCSLPVAIRSD